MASLAQAATIPVQQKVIRKPRSNWQMAFGRLRKQKLAMAGLAIVVFLIIFGFGAPIFAHTGYEYASLMDANQTPSREFPFGTDAIGHNFLSRVMFGTRTSLIVGLAAVAVGLSVGIPLGLLAGLRGGWVDFLIMRVVEVMTAFPGLLFAMVLMTVLGSGMRNIIFVIGLTNWLVICRLVRAQLLTLRETEYVAAAYCLGASPWQVAIRHLLPNALAPIIVAITLAIPTAIFSEAGLSFLGIGINEPLPSLGKMVSDSAPYIRVYWHLGLFPTAAIALIMLGFSFLGDGLRDALDPR